MDPIHNHLQRCEWEYSAIHKCDAVFTTARELYQHVSISHIGYKKYKTLATQCNWASCEFKATKRDHLTSHIKKHIDLREHECKICLKTFKRSHDLKKHVRLIHSSERSMASPSTVTGHIMYIPYQFQSHF
eukprot:NODE_168_length_14557_cov_0.729008.p11 type:complete len:131 gc:universal NODE_168_length_14557_cov_0.729008:9180-9572(+)